MDPSLNIEEVARVAWRLGGFEGLYALIRKTGGAVKCPQCAGSGLMQAGCRAPFPGWSNQTQWNGRHWTCSLCGGARSVNRKRMARVRR